eukprot:COSAG02_NODE_1222_length_13800_cov_66.755565_11_plen_68_part_00
MSLTQLHPHARVQTTMTKLDAVYLARYSTRWMALGTVTVVVRYSRTLQAVVARMESFFWVVLIAGVR